ncbi:MAG: CDP-glycerol glycerophosphotransferase family protein [Clostridia bacterium]|nr:CDP-glycerol glycerophosphotransferase family protein [Clostridia bacterium]
MTLYIDPGTGSMLFTILIGIIGAGIYSLRMLFIKLRFMLSGGKVSENDKKLPYVIFSDDKRYWNIFEPICKEMNSRGIDVVYMTASDDDKALECDLPHVKSVFVGKDNKAFAKLNFLNASVVLSTTPGLGVYQWKRSKRVDHYVHIPHASSDITLYRMFGIDYYDSILLSGDYQVKQIRKLEKLRNLPEKELVTVGIPYMDVMAERFVAAGVLPDHERTVLLAPSWGKSAILSVYGEKIFEVLLKTGYKIIIRPHPQSFKSETEMIDKLIKKYPNSDRLEWNRDTDNFEVLRRSDILISDFSGVIFDFALIYDKPVICTDPNFDVSLYDHWWLDEPLWTSGVLPKLGGQLNEENMDDLKDLIDHCIENPAFAEGRRIAAEETWEHKGEGARRTVDFLIKKYDEITKAKEEDKK